MVVEPGTRPVAVKVAVSPETGTWAATTGGEVGGEVTRGVAEVVTLELLIDSKTKLLDGAGALRNTVIVAVSPTFNCTADDFMSTMKDGAPTIQNHISKSPPSLRSPLDRRKPTLVAAPPGGWPNTSASRNSDGSFCDQMKLPLRVKRVRMPRSPSAESMS